MMKATRAMEMRVATTRIATWNRNFLKGKYYTFLYLAFCCFSFVDAQHCVTLWAGVPILPGKKYLTFWSKHKKLNLSDQEGITGGKTGGQFQKSDLKPSMQQARRPATQLPQRQQRTHHSQPELFMLSLT